MLLLDNKTHKLAYKCYFKCSIFEKSSGAELLQLTKFYASILGGVELLSPSTRASRTAPKVGHAILAILTPPYVTKFHKSVWTALTS